MTGWIGISLGDVSGIGPEVTLKALSASSASSSTRFLILGDAKVVNETNERLGLGLELQEYGEGRTKPGKIFLHDPGGNVFPEVISPGSPTAARAALAYLRAGAEKCLRQELDALVTAPVNKESILRL